MLRGVIDKLVAHGHLRQFRDASHEVIVAHRRAFSKVVAAGLIVFGSAGTSAREPAMPAAAALVLTGLRTPSDQAPRAQPDAAASAGAASPDRGSSGLRQVQRRDHERCVSRSTRSASGGAGSSLAGWTAWTACHAAAVPHVHRAAARRGQGAGLRAPGDPRGGRCRGGPAQI